MATKKKSDYQKHIAELRSQIAAARVRAKALRLLCREAITRLRLAHRVWKDEERARHRALFRAHVQLLKAHIEEARKGRKVEAFVLVDNAQRELQTLKDDHARDMLKRHQRIAWREDEHGVYTIIDDNPILLRAWKANRVQIRKEWAAAKLRHPDRKIYLEDVYAQHMHDNSQDVTEAETRSDVEHAKELTLLLRAQEREWRAGKLDPSEGELCKHPNAVRSLRGGRVCPDCGAFLKGGPTLAPKKKRPRMTAMQRRIERKRREKRAVQKSFADVPF